MGVEEMNLLKSHSREAMRGFNRHWYGQLLFLLLFSGPPKFRIRDPESSLYGEVDWVVILHLVVWGAAGLWLLWHIVRWIRMKKGFAGLTTSAKLAILLGGCLLLSAHLSGYQSLVLFKSYQLLVCAVFAAVFTYEYGVERTVGLIFWGSFSLCVLISLAAIWAPDMVWVQSELEVGRLRGDLLAQTGVVATLALISVFLVSRNNPRWIEWTAIVFLMILLGFSLMRTSYVVLIFVSFLALLMNPRFKHRRLTVLLGAGCLLLISAGTLLRQLAEYRTSEGLWTLSDRLGLWAYLTGVTLTQSPWFGLGYYSASRVYAPEYNEGLGTAHSMFFELFVGGGLISLLLFLVVCVLMTYQAIRLARKRPRLVDITAVSLFVACFAFGFVGSDVDSGPVGMTFWSLSSILVALGGSSTIPQKPRLDVLQPLRYPAGHQNSELPGEA
jgi:hypothetical protein